MAYTQENRLLTIMTPLGEDELLLQDFVAYEGISQLFKLKLTLLSENPALAFGAIVGQKVTITVRLADGGERYFHGIVSRFTQSHSDVRFTHYQAEVVPWLWLLTRTTDCRIFQNMTVPDIITKIFRDLGFSDFKNMLEGSFEPRDYCVQYRETDFNFVSRLMEQYGIFYFFEHEKDKHTLVLANSPTAHQPCPDQAQARYDYTAGTLLEEDVITGWQVEQELRPGKYALTDYNFETPSTSLAVNIASVVNVGGNGKYEIYDYPGEYPKKAQGEGLVKIRMEEEEAPHLVVRGASTCRAFTPGYRFDLEGHTSQSMNKAYILTEVQHVASVGESYITGASADAEERYSNTFTCIPHDVPYRPPRVTPRPIVQGPQTAIVVGPAGEEIHTDKYGRVKVQFHWDREGKRNENSSCWIRVSHPWAGKSWGAISIPRMSQEVIVDFLEGDPDQPIITGRVYNAEQMPPYELPANQTQTGIKSRSSKGGSIDNFNEIRFEDNKGSEEMYIHAEKDQNTVVENDQTTAVGHDQAISVENDRAETIKRDRGLEVGRDKSETVGRNKSIHVIAVHNEQIDSNMYVNVGANLAETVAINYSETVGAAMELSVGGLLAITVGAAMTETVGGAKAETIGLAKSENIGGNNSLNVGKDLHENIENDRVVKIVKDLKENIGGQHKESVEKEYILNAKKIQIVAEDEINIKTGKAEIIMKKNGDITIKGNKINVKGTGDIVIKGSNIKEN